MSFAGISYTHHIHVLLFILDTSIIIYLKCVYLSLDIDTHEND